MNEHESNPTTPQLADTRKRSFATKAGLAIAGAGLFVFGALAAPLAWQTVNVSASSTRAEVAAPALQVDSTLDEDQAALAALYEAVSPSVVNIQVESAASAVQRPEIPGFSPKIVNISSISAYTSSTMRGEYCISKAAISMVTLLFADRLAEEGINVYEIRPGIIATDMTAVVKDKYDRMIADGLTPIKRWGQPQDVANAVWAVCSGLLDFSTGEVINVDGGFHIRRL